MPRIPCPLCGSTVRVSRSNPTSRLVCEKCHAPLHLNKAGRLVMGDPPDVEKQVQALTRDLQESLGRFPLKKVVIGMAGVLVLGMALYYLFGPAEKLEGVAERAAQALARDDPASLRSLAAPGTADDVGRWYEAVHTNLVRSRQQWGGKEEVVEAHVALEDRDQHKGAVGVSIHPTTSGARDVSLANPAEATASASVPFEAVTDWTLSRWGRWQLDGRATSARLGPTPAVP